MEISFTPELEQLINDEVNSGRYPSANALICDALRHLQNQISSVSTDNDIPPKPQI